MVLGVRILQPPLNINGYENWYIGLVAIWCADWVKSSSRVLNCAGSNPVPFTNFNIIDMRNFLVLFIFAVLLSSCVDKTIDYTVYSVEKIQETSGDSERGVHTETYWLVSTDKGTYSIQPSGVWAYPQAAGMLKADSTYTIKVEGPHMPLFGEYGRITKVTKHDH